MQVVAVVDSSTVVLVLVMIMVMVLVIECAVSSLPGLAFDARSPRVLQWDGVWTVSRAGRLDVGRKSRETRHSQPRGVALTSRLPLATFSTSACPAVATGSVAAPHHSPWDILVLRSTTYGFRSCPPSAYVAIF